MFEIEAGPDLDKAVADVIGIDVRRREPLGDEPHDWITQHSGQRFAPSSDLNTAFAAAEKVGLFSGCDHILGQGSVDEADAPWWVNHTRDRDDELSMYSQVGAGATAALAICAAILNVAKQRSIDSCDHEFVDARNEVVQNGELCVKCGAIRW